MALLNVRNVAIKGISACVPKTVEENRNLSVFSSVEDAEKFMLSTGVERRRRTSADICTSDLCLAAAERLLQELHWERNTVDCLIFVSQTPDYILPATSCILQNRLGLNEECYALDISLGCSGWVYGLSVLASLLTSGTMKRGLLLAGDTTSRMMNPNDKSLRMVFGDCGTASLVTVGNTSMGFHIQSDGSGADRLIVPAGGFRLPVSEETSVLKWDEDKNGRTMNDLFMDGMAIFNFAITEVHKNVNSLIEYMDWVKEDVGFYAFIRQMNLW